MIVCNIFFFFFIIVKYSKSNNLGSHLVDPGHMMRAPLKNLGGLRVDPGQTHVFWVSTWV